MGRTALTDGSGAWFDTTEAVVLHEDSRWDGRNHISVATGSQWEHEWLYYTKSGKWVLHCYSQWQGSSESYEQIEESDAIKWLIENRRFDDDGMKKLPEAVRERVKAGFESAEI